MPAPSDTASVIDDERFAELLKAVDPDVAEAPAMVLKPAKLSIDSVDPSIWLKPLPSGTVSSSGEPALFDLRKAPTLSDRLGVLAGPLAFVFLMIVGAAAAAFVFRDRVVQIL